MEKFYDYYTKEIKEDTLPEGNEYDFLLERNKNHMNDTALSFDTKKYHMKNYMKELMNLLVHYTKEGYTKILK